MGEVTKRRGRVLGMHPAEDGQQTLESDVPVSEMHDCTTYLRQLTQGRGSFVFEFTRYEPLPSNLEPTFDDSSTISKRSFRDCFADVTVFDG